MDEPLKTTKRFTIEIVINHDTLIYTTCNKKKDVFTMSTC